MIPAIIAPYLPSYAGVLVYMLQNTEYQVGPYLAWYWRTQNFAKAVQRRQLDRTRAARLLLLALRAGMIAQILLGLMLLYFWYWQSVPGAWAFGLALIVSYPVVWAHLVVLPLVAGRVLVVAPHARRLVKRSEKIFRNHKGIKIAVVGSYGKTSMKEILLTVLSEGKNVAATPANKNVAVAHAQFARSLTGDEDILLIEYGEGVPGDVANFARITHPDYAIITGVAAAHLDRYKTTAAAGEDIFSVAKYIGDGSHVCVNGESAAARPFIEPDFKRYDRSGGLRWKVSEVDISLEGTKFALAQAQRGMLLSTKLLGRHQLGPLSLAAALADEFGLSDTQIKGGIAKTAPFEHRMRPYPLNGAWIIDDTYNGNIEGIRAGTALLTELPAMRKIYVTPGLVDQGDETQAIHEEMGKLIAGAKPDKVVLMQNSVTGFIRRGLEAANFSGELVIESKPLNFYTNLAHFVATGDLVLMQNDWPDNYA